MLISRKNFRKNRVLFGQIQIDSPFIREGAGRFALIGDQARQQYSDVIRAQSTKTGGEAFEILYNFVAHTLHKTRRAKMSQTAFNYIVLLGNSTNRDDGPQTLVKELVDGKKRVLFNFAREFWKRTIG